MTLLRGHFAMTLVVSPPEPAGCMRRSLRSRLMGCWRSPCGRCRRSPSSIAGTPYVLSVHGGDRPGIVSASPEPWQPWAATSRT